MVKGVDGNSGIQWNKKLADELDKLDGNPGDGKIDANIWNDFLKMMQSKGNTIQYSIDVEKASNNFEFYKNTKDKTENWNEEELAKKLEEFKQYQANKKTTSQQTETQKNDDNKQSSTVKSQNTTPKNGDTPTISNDIEMNCHDDSNNTEDIQGKVKIVKKGANEGDLPQAFTITDNSSGQDHIYKYEFDGFDDSGKALYKCVSMNNRAITADNQYTLIKDTNGNPRLMQYEAQSNYGIGLQVGEETEEDDETENDDNSPKILTKEEKDKAYKTGIQISDDLVGYTTNKDVTRTRDLVNTLVNEDNILYVLYGYEQNKTIVGNHFFEQCDREDEFATDTNYTKQKLMQDIATKLQKQLERAGKTEEAKKIAEILEDHNITRHEAIELDKLVEKELKILKETEKEVGKTNSDDIFWA